MKAIVDKYNTYYEKLEKQCGKCKNTKACIQCMFNLADLDGKPVCHGFMNEESFKNYVNAQMRFLERNPGAYKKLMEEVIVVLCQSNVVAFRHCELRGTKQKTNQKYKTLDCFGLRPHSNDVALTG
jgi:hypothetical protein